MSGQLAHTQPGRLPLEPPRPLEATQPGKAAPALAAAGAIARPQVGGLRRP